MIIAIPTNDKKTISEHFGRSEYFLIYDTETKQKKYINNPHATEENNLMGHAKLLKALKTEKAEKIILLQRRHENGARHKRNRSRNRIHRRFRNWKPFKNRKII